MQMRASPEVIVPRTRRIRAPVQRFQQNQAEPVEVIVPRTLRLRPLAQRARRFFQEDQAERADVIVRTTCRIRASAGLIGPRTRRMRAPVQRFQQDRAEPEEVIVPRTLRMRASAQRFQQDHAEPEEVIVPRTCRIRAMAGGIVRRTRRMRSPVEGVAPPAAAVPVEGRSVVEVLASGGGADVKADTPMANHGSTGGRSNDAGLDADNEGVLPVPEFVQVGGSPLYKQVQVGRSSGGGQTTVRSRIEVATGLMLSARNVGYSSGVEQDEVLPSGREVVPEAETLEEARRSKRVVEPSVDQPAKRSRPVVPGVGTSWAVPTATLPSPLPVVSASVSSAPHTLTDLPDWRAVFHGSIHGPSHCPPPSNPNQYHPNREVGISDQCYDPLVARSLNTGRILPRDYDQLSHIPVLQLLDYIHVYEAEGRVLQGVCIERVREELARLESVIVERDRLREELAASNRLRDQYRKDRDDAIRMTCESTDEVRERATKLHEEIAQLRRKFLEEKTHADNVEA